MKFLAGVPRFVFFTGKGGVGKTSIACAAAVTLARAGRRLLLVSTDPASNVGQVFGVTVGNTVTAIAGVPGLWALEIDPEQAVTDYRERILAPMRGVLPEADIASMTEQLSGSCTTEVASFNEFTALLTDETSGYDHVLFDTAPTGHTIRLLQLPGSWSEFLTGGGDASCLGPLSGLDKQKAVYAAAVDATGSYHRDIVRQMAPGTRFVTPLMRLQNPEATKVLLITLPETTPVLEAAELQADLERAGIHPWAWVIDNSLAAAAPTDPLLRRRAAAELDQIHRATTYTDRYAVIPALAEEPVGIPALAALTRPTHTAAG
ncbi:TRC40/GET3/ArsA family transport-energizing ATPase [Nocardia nova]|uniref:TRC40/GET3/ArsA family transport-energizing ATPase n=1 Tax=Nocardia nova TaxID=37330 RepID=UPI001C440A33|nr:TRC40/GET3/ArsA family transport-energizing ATPase [Nocardia nova]MBV7707619.1 TRC40/GET3/ArsA family transport-energizing ATPase [Nocardia nova]